MLAVDRHDVGASSHEIGDRGAAAVSERDQGVASHAFTEIGEHRALVRP